MKGRPGWDGPATRALLLEALLDLPLGASMREVAQRIGKHVGTVEHHVKRLRKTGQVQVVKRGYKKRKVVVPIRLRLSETEAEWLRLGTVTARAIVVVARADGKRVLSRDVAQALGCRHSTARYHLTRASRAGILDGRNMQGYVLAEGDANQREIAGLHPRTWKAVRYVAEKKRLVSSGELARAFDWSEGTVNYHLKRATRAGLLAPVVGRAGGYTLTPLARSINWRKSNLAPT